MTALEQLLRFAQENDAQFILLRDKGGRWEGRMNWASVGSAVAMDLAPEAVAEALVQQIAVELNPDQIKLYNEEEPVPDGV